ncbi:hypothetical protein [Mycobacterium sp. 852013-50091_SCH5140682]|uniref:hypothetical protein n=1 Tax=Mycobacterium sp. 852013-50091_SCH5140682 TaxID=1834109 RepID=UPI000A777520|nr:hypothetical protein [Mycobacterium sp. 852013-50091_SCH5140682]
MGEGEFTRPVELAGVDGTRVRRSRAGLQLTLRPEGMTLVRDGAATEIAWHEITGITQIAMMPRWSTTKAWAIMGPAGPIYPYEFDKQWTTGPIGRWLAHYRPDLELPDASDAVTLPLGIPQRIYPWVIAPGVLIGVVAQKMMGTSLLVSVFGTVGCLAVILLCVSSPRRVRIAGGVAVTIGCVSVLVAGLAWLIGAAGLSSL